MKLVARGCLFVGAGLLALGCKPTGSPLDVDSDVSTASAVAAEEVVDGDLSAAQRRGDLLVRMRRALELAMPEALSRKGPEDVVLPIVDVDPGGVSGQVVMIRWRPDQWLPHNPDPTKGERWLLVALSLDPDRVLDVEMLHGTVAEGSLEHRRLAAQFTGTKRALDQHPGARFEMHTVRERYLDGGTRTRDANDRFRGYLFGAPGTPDLELVFAPEGKKVEPVVEELRVVHPVVEDDVLVTELGSPGAMAVARVLSGQVSQSSVVGNEVMVRSQGDRHWTISMRTGVITPAQSQ